MVFRQAFNFHLDTNDFETINCGVLHRIGAVVAGLHNMADHRTIGRSKFFRLAEKIEDKTVRG